MVVLYFLYANFQYSSDASVPEGIEWDWRSAQVSQPQSSKLATADWKMMYFDFRSAYGLFQKMFEGSHGFTCLCDAVGDVVVIGEVEGYVDSKVFKVGGKIDVGGSV